MLAQVNLADKLAELIRPGDQVMWGQAAAEPLTLSEAMVEHRARIGHFSVFLCVAYAETVKVEHTDYLTPISIGTLGATRSLAAASKLKIIPYHVSQLCGLIEQDELRCDVALIQLSAPGPNGKRSLGPAADYIETAIRHARVVIAEINDQLPWTYGCDLPDLDNLALTIETSRPLPRPMERQASRVEQAIAKHIADIIPDGATLQLGVGGTVDALFKYLGDRRDLGIHSGAIGDSVVDLIERGIVTNARKPIDRGITVTGSLFGGPRLMEAAACNPAIHVRSYRYTHDAAVLSQIPNLFAVNSALQVDLSGQVNAEMTDGRYLGAIGGQIDFMHAATRTKHGRSIIALPSTAAGGTISRIVPRADIVTTARSEVDFVVTEHGSAQMRGVPLEARAAKLMAIADHAFREQLERASHSKH